MAHLEIGRLLVENDGPALLIERLGSKMRNLASLILLTAVVLPGRAAWAQDGADEAIPLYAVDVRAAYAKFQSRLDLEAVPLFVPSYGLGLNVGAHLYPLRWRTVTFGIGGEFAICLGRRTTPIGDDPDTTLSTLETRFQSLAPQISLNFGRRQGWSYISGGIGRANYWVRSGGAAVVNASDVNLTAVNYGAGARWFFNAHLAFTLDLRLYSVPPNPATETRYGTPRMHQFVVSSGLSFH